MKSKKIITILLSLAIMVTFMPAMAFADYSGTDGTGKWATDGSKYTVTVGTETRDFATTREWNNDGSITATINPSTKLPSEYDDFEQIAYTKEQQTSYTYVDLSNSKVIYTGQPTVDTVGYAAITNSAGTELNQNAFDVWMSKPSYVKGYNATTDAEVGASLKAYMTANSETAQLVFSSADMVFNADYTQTPTVAALLKPVKGSGTYSTVKNYFGDINATKFTVSGKKSFAFGIDTLTSDLSPATFSNDTWTLGYDGETHKLVNSTVDGFKIEYEVLDNTTNKWNAVETVEVKNVNRLDSAGYTVRFRVKNTRKNVYVSLADLTTVSNLYNVRYINVIKARDFGFALSVGNANTHKDDLVDVGENANPMDYLKGTYSRYLGTHTETTGGYWQQTVTVTDYGTFDIAAADNAEALNYFNEVYEVKATPNKADSTRVTWTVAKKSGVSMADVNKKYAQFLANYGTDTTTTGSGSAVEVRVGANDNEDDISFSGQTKYTYSGKKTTKKGVLKAKKTITVKATADSGNAITYVATKTAGGKITVSSTGKITVKKGLKKGTYKVTVKAKTAAGNGFKAAKEKQTYTIVIKK